MTMQPTPTDATLITNPDTLRIAAYDLNVFVFFRGHWCPFCQAYLRELDGTFRERVEAAGGRLVGITSQSAEGATLALEGWGLHYDVLSDPSNGLADTFGANITPRDQTPLADVPTEYPNGMAQPAVIATDRNGKVLYQWAIVPSEMNIGGASDRPLPDDIWAAIEAARAGSPPPVEGNVKLDPAFLQAHYPKLHKTFTDWVAAAQASQQ